MALALALDDPDAVGGLVLLSGYYKPTARLDVPLAAPPAIPVIGDVLRYTVSPLLGRAMLPLNLKAMFAPQAAARAVPSRLPVWLSGPAVADPCRSTGRRYHGAGRGSATRRYHELRLPVTIMAGTQDQIVDVDGHAVWFHEAIPGSELRLVPDTGHMFHYAVPEQVAEAITAMADRLQVSRLEPASARPATRQTERSAA